MPLPLTPPPTHPPFFFFFFCVAKRKKGDKDKKERVSKQKLLKDDHQGQNIIVLAILERHFADAISWCFQAKNLKDYSVRSQQSI